MMPSKDNCSRRIDCSNSRDNEAGRAESIRCTKMCAVMINGTPVLIAAAKGMSS